MDSSLRWFNFNDFSDHLYEIINISISRRKLNHEPENALFIYTYLYYSKKKQTSENILNYW